MTVFLQAVQSFLSIMCVYGMKKYACHEKVTTRKSVGPTDDVNGHPPKIRRRALWALVSKEMFDAKYSEGASAAQRITARNAFYKQSE